MIKDVASVLDMHFAQINEMTRNIPRFMSCGDVDPEKIRDVDSVSIVDEQLVEDTGKVRGRKKSWGLLRVSARSCSSRQSGR